jgi:hypothetical protein
MLARPRVVASPHAEDNVRARGIQMRRRVFLKSAGAAAALSALPLVAASAAAPAMSAGFVLLRSDSDATATPIRPFGLSDCSDCNAERVFVQIDDWQPALAGPVVSEFQLRAIFELEGGGEAPFLAWHYAADALAGSRSYSTRFAAGRASLRRFDLEYRRCDSISSARSSCSLTRLDLPLLTPGHYMLVGPDASGAPLGAASLWHSGEARAPIDPATLPGHDYLAFRISASA